MLSNFYSWVDENDRWEFWINGLGSFRCNAETRRFWSHTFLQTMTAPTQSLSVRTTLIKADHSSHCSVNTHLSQTSGRNRAWLLEFLFASSLCSSSAISATSLGSKVFSSENLTAGSLMQETSRSMTVHKNSRQMCPHSLKKHSFVIFFSPFINTKAEGNKAVFIWHPLFSQ